MLFRLVGAEIDAGGDGDAGVFQQVPAELVAVVGEALAVRIDVEGAFRRDRDVEA